MATMEPYYPPDTKISYTLSEAVEVMKLMDQFPTAKSITWVNAKTGKRVSIGYTN